MIVLIYNEDKNEIERYNRNLSDPMPYIKYKFLTLKEFRGSSKSTILWSSKKTMEAFNTTRNHFGAIYVGYAFKRIFEGGHSKQSQHYAGTSFDCGQKWAVSKRKQLYNIARKLNVWSYVEPINLTPSWVHFDKRDKKSACSAGFPTLRKNSKSTYVMILQDCLIYLGYNIVLDGILGNGTLNAIKSFQRKNSLSADGIVGCNTWTKIIAKVYGKGKNSYTKYYS